jgi:aubergine-like protein
MCAKIGGEPWALDKLPYMDDITMVCGMDVYHNTGKNSKSILAFCASVNDRAT